MIGSEWVDVGGPQIVLPEALLPAWHGGDGDDYDRACAVGDHAGTIPVGDGQGLVLGDEPAMTRYLPANRAFVRWIAADSPADLLARTTEVLADPATPWRDLGTWTTPGPAVLMGAVHSGAEILAADTSDDPPPHAPAPVPAGTWSVRATYDDRAPRAHVLIVRLDPV